MTWGQAKWERCEECGIATYDIDNHVCHEQDLAAKDVAELLAEFEAVVGPQKPVTDANWRRFRWKPFEKWYAVWADSLEGQFDRYYWRRAGL